MRKPEFDRIKKAKFMIKTGMRYGIVPEFDLKPLTSTSKKAESQTDCCSRLFARSDQYEDSDEEELPKNMAHLKGKKVHIKMIQEAERQLFQRTEYEDEEVSKVSIFDSIIIYTRDEKRSIVLDIWLFYIALLSIYSGIQGIYMGSFMLELNGSPFDVTTSFEAFYLVVEIS